MDENIGKKPIKVEKNNEISNSPVVNKKEHGFVKSDSKKYIYIFLLIFALIATVLIIRLIPKDIEKIKDSVVMLRVYDKEGNELGTGSGFCAFKSNYIVTNFHVIEGGYKIKIITDDNKEYSINKVLIFSSEDDLAIISGNFELTPLKIGSASNLKAGKTITAIGSPMGELNTVSTGVISNADNDYEIRITAPISPGSSGGVLCDKKGNVIGITYATYNSIDSQNINYAISVKYLNKMYTSLKNEEYYEVTESNYKNFTPNITNTTMPVSSSSFSKYVWEKGTFNRPDELSFKGKANSYYFVTNMNTFSNATNKENLFENALSDFGEYSLKDEYFKMSDEEKKKVILNYEYLRNYDSYNRELSSNISSWEKEQFILELKLMQCQELSIFLVQFNKLNNKDKVVKLLNKMGNSYETNTIIHKVLFENDNSYNDDICKTIDQSEYWSYDEKVEILRYLGMHVDESGTITW